MKVISIANHKGGTAKTTTAVNLAMGLQSMGLRVLAIDLDPQANLTWYLGIHKFEYDSANVLIGDVPLKEAILAREDIHVLPSGPDLGRVEVSLSAFKARHLVLKSLLSEIRDYDFVVIDCPPSNYLLVQNALAASDLLLMPLKMEALQLKGLANIMTEARRVQTSHNPGLRVLGALPVMFEPRKRFVRNRFRRNELAMFQYVRDTLKIPLLQTRIHKDLAAVEAPAHGQSLSRYAPQSRAWKDYQQLAHEVAQPYMNARQGHR